MLHKSSTSHKEKEVNFSFMMSLVLGFLLHAKLLKERGGDVFASPDVTP